MFLFLCSFSNLLSQWQVNHFQNEFSVSGIKWAQVPIDPKSKKMETATSNDVIYIVQ